MKRVFAVLLLLPCLCGCLSPAPAPTVSRWLIEFRGAPAVAKAPKYGIARLSQVVVSQPYAGDRVVVLKKDGSVALDGQNVFVAPPSALLRDVCTSALKASGLFADVVGASSGVSTPCSVEFAVNRIVLDCREEGGRRAVVSLLVRVLDGRSVVAKAEGEGAFDASSGDYGSAFSTAASSAVSSALSKLR